MHYEVELREGDDTSSEWRPINLFQDAAGVTLMLGSVQDTCKKWSQASQCPSTALRPARLSLQDTRPFVRGAKVRAEVS
jgi:hypothetical protein